ncbi:hypothetical protein CDV36_014759 [Fusarium kuroshium]|uniref:Uncharacterized protein n=1 Tax=Fusarium kuroshium TaxID=2010991 RepID=A0A3M2RFJ2_9HYPO|nr:hypothetical protein CDV36_014759 [Fusarium kuroshium]
MGTRGLWAFRHGGRYYIFWNEYDSDELGETLALGVPRDPSEFQAWLDEKRSDCDALAQRLERAWIVSLDAGVKLELLPEIAGAEDLFLAPGYVRPHGDLFLEHTVVADLDREVLDCDGVCFFLLAQLPQTLDPWLKSANRYWLGLDAEPETPCITTNAVPAPPHDNEEVIVSKYRALCPRFEVPLSPTTTPMNASEALVSSMTQAFAFMSQMYDRAITQARDTCYENDHLFREVSYLLLSMASCSPDHVRLANAEGLGWPARAEGCLDTLSLIKYGILGGHGDAQPRELASTFLSDFHEANKAPGSAPSVTSYWMGSVLVWLTRDILSLSRFEAAICAAVAEGRAVPGKHEFRVVVFSIRHFVLVHVTPDVVFHSKRYALWTRPATAEISYIESEQLESPFQRSTTLENSVNHGGPGDSDWVSDNHQHSFEALARFFLNACPPSESQPFKALRELAVDRKLTVVNQLKGELDLLQSFDPNEIEDKGLFPQLNRENVMDGRVRCILVVRASSSSCTSSMLAVPVLWEAWANPLRVKMADESVEVAVSDGLTCKRLNRTYRAQIPRQRLGAFLQMASRVRPGAPGARRRSVCFMALFKPASEDTPEGWAQAEAEAQKQAELEYFRETFGFWINKEKTDMYDLAVFVVIGTKFRLFHVANHPQIPTMEEVPPDTSFDIEESRKWWSHDPPWQHCPGMKPYLDRARSELRFGDVNAGDVNNGSAHDGKGRRPPLNTRAKEDRPAIEIALAWARELADLHGKQETEELVAPDLYLWP